MPVQDIIIDQIKQSGPVSFHQFMETALYHPGQGYYTSPRNHIGKDGDYYTSPYLSQYFGRMLAIQLEEIWNKLPAANGPFTVVEYGAGNGEMALDILQKLKYNQSLYEQLRYIIIEKSHAMQQRQQQRLTEKVEWVEDITILGPFTGCVLTNEVLDNFAVHQVLMLDELMEVFVDYETGFKETLCPADKILKDYLADLGIQLPLGQRTEINLEAIKWLEQIAGVLTAGAVVVIDYGGSSAELLSSKWREGTLLCYKNHTVKKALFVNPGEQDITAHVNFSALKHYGEKVGFQFGGYTSQGRMLQSLGLCQQLQQEEERPAGSKKISGAAIQMLQALLLEMGNAMKVLCLKKDMPCTLRGMQFPLPL
jgi:SAM-dependent MidA family methyltransferase